MSESCVIMGWDAAWTPHGSGAWSVVRKTTGAAKKQLLLWEETPQDSELLTERMNDLVQKYRPDLIAIDMPVSEMGVRGYREADRATTRAFSAYGCPVHSPTPKRPGAWGEHCLERLNLKGYHVCTDKTALKCGIAEVYPHTVLLDTLRLSYRYPYKVSRHRQLWPGVSPDTSRAKCRSQLETIYKQLASHIDLPPWHTLCPELKPLTSLKAFEDKMDALLCAWAGCRIMEGAYIPYGDSVSAIWNPDLINLDPPNRTP